MNALRFGGMVGYWRDLAARLYIRAREYQPGEVDEEGSDFEAGAGPEFLRLVQAGINPPAMMKWSGHCTMYSNERMRHGVK